MPVVEISDSYLGTTVYADIHYLSRLVGEELAVSGVQLAIDRDPAHRARAVPRAETDARPAGRHRPGRHDPEPRRDRAATTKWIIIGLLVLFAGVVFFGSILNASLVSLAERQREVATLRVLGYGPWQIGSLLLAREHDHHRCWARCWACRWATC